MTDLRKAAQMALEALDGDHPDIQLRAAITLRAALAQPEPFQPDWDRVKALEESLREHMAEIQRLKALAQPEQEPQWDEVFDAATRSYVRSASSRETLRLCFQHRTGNDQVAIGWTAQELMAFAKQIASLYTAPPQRKPLTDVNIKGIVDLGLQTWKLSESTVEFARAIEAAHGIGGEHD